MWKVKLEDSKIYLLYIVITFLLSFLLKSSDIGVILIYLLLLFITYKELKKNLLNTWAWVIILVFAQFFLLDNLLPYIFKINRYTLDILKFWKELVILQSIYLLIKDKEVRIKFLENIKSDKKLFYLIISISIFIISMIITIPKASSIFMAIYGMRIYLLGYILMLIFFIGNFRKKEISNFINKVAVAFAYLSIFGIFQAVFLGDNFLINLGYGVDGALSSSYYISGYFGRQRVVSTFASPNTFGLLCAIFCMYYIYSIYNEYENKKLKSVKIFYLGVIFISLLLSYSRSAYIAFAIGFITFVFMELNKKFKIILSLSIIITGGLTVVLSYLFVDKVENMFINHIFRTITLKDTSAIGHIESTKYAMSVMKENPWGVGVGMSGQKSLQFMENALHAENSYFIVGFDLGIFGLIAYISILIILGYILAKMYNNKIRGVEMIVNKLAFTSFLAIYISFVFLPTIQELEVAYIFFPLIGLAFNMKKQKGDLS